VENNETVHINGFTLTNNEHEPNTGYDVMVGGGVCVKEDSQVTVSNCIIRNCTARHGAGIGTTSGEGSVEISNVQIYENKAFYRGGVYIDTDFQFDFNNVNLCSVYNNTAAMGMDIMLYDWDDYYDGTENFPTIEINLDICSRQLTEPDQFFISTMFALAEVNIETGFLDEIDHDIYVSPVGSDENTGLSPSQPFQTLMKAMQLIKSNPNNPRSIYLAPGTYTQSQNNQIFPLPVKSNVDIIGAGSDTSILDAEETASFFGILYAENIGISGMSLNNSIQRSIPAVITCYGSENLRFEELWINNFEKRAFKLSLSQNIIIGNITAESNPKNDQELESINAFESSDIRINNFISKNLILSNIDYNSIGMIFQECDANISNAIFSGCEAEDGAIFSFQNAVNPESTNRLIMNNCLFYDNHVDTGEWTFAPVYIQDRYQTPVVTNCTFANNSGNSNCVRIIAGIELSNSIFYNPDCYGELFLKNRYTNIYVDPPVTEVADVELKNCLFSSGQPASTIPEQAYFTDCLYNTDPLFLG
jgi:hypothetical protein